MSKHVFKVGIDVGKDELWAKYDGVKARRFTNSGSGVQAMVTWARSAAKEDRVHFCMESTGVYSESVAYRLVTLENTEVSIVNPARIVAYGKAQMRRTKTDAVDVQVILSFAQTQEPQVWTPDSKSLRQLYYLVAQQDRIRHDIRQWNNRRHAHSFCTELPDAVRKSNQAVLRTLTRQLQRIERAISELCQTDSELKENIQLLCTIPGIAHLSAVKVLAYGRSALTERNRKQLTAHAGLAPRHHQSGTSVRGRSHIAKQGDPRLRTALYMPALVGMQYNPILKPFYNQILENGKPKMVGIVACMRKLLMIIRAMLINKQPFNPSISA